MILAWAGPFNVGLNFPEKITWITAPLSYFYILQVRFDRQIQNVHTVVPRNLNSRYWLRFLGCKKRKGSSKQLLSCTFGFVRQHMRDMVAERVKHTMYGVDLYRSLANVTFDNI